MKTSATASATDYWLTDFNPCSCNPYPVMANRLCLPVVLEFVSHSGIKNPTYLLVWTWTVGGHRARAGGRPWFESCRHLTAILAIPTSNVRLDVLQPLTIRLRSCLWDLRLHLAVWLLLSVWYWYCTCEWPLHMAMRTWRRAHCFARYHRQSSFECSSYL